MENSKKKFYQKKWFMWLTLVFIPPVGIATIWTVNKKMHKVFKIALTAVFSFWFLILAIGVTVDSEDDSSAQTNDISEVAEEAQPQFEGYTLIEVDGGDLSGIRQPNVVVDIGFGDREYWAFTNEYGQLVKVIADEIILQDESTEPVTSEGRYYSDEAKVPGTESAVLDEGHVIADSLGGVANAYNITPQDSTLNRYGDQAYMEDVIRQAGGCTDFVALITYPDINTQIPSFYSYTYTLDGSVVTDVFPNENPEAEQESEDSTTTNSEDTSTTSSDTSNTTTSTPDTSTTTTAPSTPAVVDHTAELKKIDTNGNGTVTIAEAEAAGYSMPIHSDFWLYDYMIDRDGDGTVGE